VLGSGDILGENGAVIRPRSPSGEMLLAQVSATVSTALCQDPEASVEIRAMSCAAFLTCHLCDVSRRLARDLHPSLLLSVLRLALPQRILAYTSFLALATQHRKLPSFLVILSVLRILSCHGGVLGDARHIDVDRRKLCRLAK